jgi:hypothetical protein
VSFGAGGTGLTQIKWGPEFLRILQNSFTLALNIFKLPPINGPPQPAQYEKYQNH